MFHAQCGTRGVRSLLAIVAVLGLCPAAHAAFLIAPVAATATNTYNPVTTSAELSWNGAGFDAAEQAILQTNDPIPTTWPTHGTAGLNMHWHNGASPSLAITYDLGDSYALQGLHLWNLNQSADPDRGLRRATVAVSTNGTDFGDLTLSGLDANGYFIRAPGLDTYTGEDYGFDTVLGRYVRFTILDNWNGDLTYAGISEVRFVAVPEPGTLTLLALGGLALMRRRRAA